MDDVKHKSYRMLHSWSLVLREHKELGLGVEGDVHGVLGTGDQGAVAVQALLTVASITYKCGYTLQARSCWFQVTLIAFARSLFA